MSLLAALIGCLLVCQPKQRLPDKRNSANKMLKGKVPRWRVEAQSLPYSQYFLAEKKPQDFDHVKFLTWLQPSSLERRELTSEWLDKVIPALQSCSYKELQDSGNRLKREWNSKIASRGIFWSNLAESEKREQEKKERMARLKAGGEERLQAAEKFIIDETKKDFKDATNELASTSSLAAKSSLNIQDTLLSSSTGSSNMPSTSYTASTEYTIQQRSKAQESSSISQPQLEKNNRLLSTTLRHSTKTSNSSTNKKKKDAYATEEPWHSLTMALAKIVNCEKGVRFPQKPTFMTPVHSELFQHAVNMLTEYQAQDDQQKDITLVKDAQVAMSCVFNTLSERACDHFSVYEDGSTVADAVEQSLINGFTQHPCKDILLKYIPILEEMNVEGFQRKLKKDLGSLQEKYTDPPLPSVIIEDKTLEILILLCKSIIRPHFGTASPSEMDCLHLWVSVFSAIADQVTLHTGEKALEASKSMRRMQSSEYGDVSDTGRKVDCIFMYKGIELSNIEFKCPNICPQDIAIQNRKNVRLARCIQEAHLAIGVSSPSILMADVSGFGGIFYQVQPMGNIAIAGMTTPEAVQLPKNKVELLMFLEDNSLPIIWNYIEHLEKQALNVLAAKQRTDAIQKRERFTTSIIRPKAMPSQLPLNRSFTSNVTFSPTKKRSTLERPTLNLEESISPTRNVRRWAQNDPADGGKSNADEDT